MVVTLGQQYNVGEKSAVIVYCTLTTDDIDRHAGTPDRHQKQNRSNVVHHHTYMVVIIYCCIDRHKDTLHGI